MELLTKILAVAAGGALGALLRYFINVSPLGTLFAKFPFHTFFINLSGSLLIGMLAVLFAEKFEAYENLRLALMVGFLGAYTTFSTFELETFGLIEKGEYLTAFGYLLSSVFVGFIGVALGVWLARKM